MDVNFFFKFWLNYAIAIVDFSHRLDPVFTEVMPLIRPSRLDSACSSIFSNKRTLLEYHQQRNVFVQRYNNAMMEMIFRVQTIGGIECMNVIEITTCLPNGTITECTGVGKGSA